MKYNDITRKPGNIHLLHPNTMLEATELETHLTVHTLSMRVFECITSTSHDLVVLHTKQC